MPNYNIGKQVITKVHMLITTTSIKYDKSNDQTQSRENANYFLGGIDKSFPYAGIVFVPGTKWCTPYICADISSHSDEKQAAQIDIPSH